MRSKTVDRLLKNTPKDVEIFVDWYADLLVRINQILQEKGISQKALAEQMGKKPSEISKWMNGEHNFTLRSLAKLSAELGEPLLTIPKCTPHTKFTRGNRHSIRTFVSTKDSKTTLIPHTIEWQKTVELKPLKNVG